MVGEDPDEESDLDAVGLTTLLVADPRPTFIVDASRSACIVFANPACHEIFPLIEVNQPDKASDPLLQWAFAANSFQAVHRGRSWTLFNVGRWRVVTCNADEKLTSTRAATPPVSTHDAHPAKRQRAQTPLVRELSTDSIPIPLRRGSSSENSRLSGQDTKYVDWTQADLPGLTAYTRTIRDYDWASTPLGALVFWPLELRLIVMNIMDNPDPRLILWGPESILIYNEACVPIIGQRHPKALGKSPWHAFPDIWDQLAPIVQASLHNGKTTQVHQMPLTLERNPVAGEETYFSFVMQPILGEDGHPAGVLDQFTESTSVVLAERRMRTVLQVGENTADADTLDGVWKGILAALDSNVDDIPFAMLYSVVNNMSSHDHSDLLETGSHGSNSPGSLHCVLEGTAGFESVPLSIQEHLSLVDEGKPFVQQFRDAWTQRQFILVSADDGTLPVGLSRPIPGRVSGLACSQAVVCPIFSLTASNCLAFLILGISPRRPYDEDYKLFVRLLNDRVDHSAAAVSLPKEQRRVQAAAEEAAIRHAASARQLLTRTLEAEQREAKFTRMASAAPVGCYLLRVDGTPIYLNDAYYEITGIEKPEQVSFNEDSIWRQQTRPEDIPLIENTWTELTQDKKPSTVEYRLRREWRAVDKVTGVEMCGPTWLLVSAFPELDDDGEVKTIMGWVSDISLQKWTEALQTKRLAEALESKRQSERFIDLVSHEMRNPLSAILQSADSILLALSDLTLKIAANNAGKLATGELLDTVADGAKTIVLCAQHQKRIIDDILTFSKLDSDLLVLCPEQVRPIDLTRKALKMYEAELQSADISADIIVDKSYETLAVDTVFLDPSRLLQVLINLLTNAIKFTRGRLHRRIIMTIRATETWPPAYASISYMPRRDSRPEASLSHEWGDGPEIYLLFAVEDTGPGLSPEEMSSLFMRFSQANPRTHVQYGGSGLGLFISKELTELQGGQIGGESRHGEGSTFAFYIKARRGESSPENILKSPQSGKTAQRDLVTDLIAPPSEPEPLQPLAPTIGLPSPDQTSLFTQISAIKTARQAEDLHVLIVEDNIINQRVMMTGLKRLGCTVHVANHGLEAIEFLEKSTFMKSHNEPSPGKQAEKSTSSTSTPIPLSVILLDLEMPVMDGLSCIQKIREMERNGELQGHVPVAAVTANARTEQLNIALNHGMDLVITKPFRIPDLVPKMLALVEGHRVINQNPIFSYVETRRDSV